jgi:hypothetical protein
MEKLKDISETLVFASTANTFNNILQECIIEKIDLELKVMSDGTAYFHDSSEKKLFKSYFDENEKITDIRYNQSSITISFQSILAKYLLKEQDKSRAQQIGIIDENEAYIMDLISKGDFKCLSVFFNDKKPTKIEFTENLENVESGKRLSEIFVKGAYQTIEIKSENGNVKHIVRTTKIKL